MPTPRERWSPGATGATSLWVRTVPGWHVAFALFVVIAGVVLLLSHAPHRGWAAVAVAVVALAYVLLGAPGARSRGRGTRVYLAVVVVALGVAYACEPSLNFLLFIAFPQGWFLTDTRREGTAWTVATAVSGLVGMSLGYGDAARTTDIAVSMLVSVAFTCALGFWISRVIAQSAERAELISQLESTRAELAAAHHEAGVATERARLAADIHDTLAQDFTGIVLMAQTAAAAAGEDALRRRLAVIEDAARAGLAEARTLVAAMSPVGLEDAGTLAEALHRLAERVSRESGVSVDVVVRGQDPLALPKAQQVVLLRAAQEALGNVRKHAGARSAHVVLAAADGRATLEVHDDGVGISAEAVSGATGFGLAGTRRRVEEAGGVFEVVGEPGGGTRLRIDVPSEPVRA
ncbi:sensor histidine kinase [Kineococcus rhizosphaerae]|uniref:Oxygen sensor histidine kinase NreB n=1 Tax=Kineococcus rhizosphaerae TaxID=559628 RepID=A0A2T0R562_9ACTN|nr:sensor histidine kinase [Kineococcus rhizosphaerae]PRY15900.1 signal transduction histidine kinase [Kineococcus rhizosphaerae]